MEIDTSEAALVYLFVLLRETTPLFFNKKEKSKLMYICKALLPQNLGFNIACSIFF